MGFQIERTNMVGCTTLMRTLVKDFAENGFVIKSNGGVFDYSVDSMVVMDVTSVVDPLAADQPWRIKIESMDQSHIKMYVATDNQISESGLVTKLESGAFGASSGLKESAGVLGTDKNPIEGAGDYFFSMKGFTLPADLGSYPLSYQLSISPRGFALCIWVQAEDPQGNRFSWVVVQRPVDHKTGNVLVEGKAPVFCLYYTALSAQDEIFKFIVRESDIMKPTVSVKATIHTEDSRAILNHLNQVAIGEDNKYVVQFPNNLNTPRYSYTQELDMVGITSSDVVSQWAEVPLTVYGEPGQRIYRAMRANGPNNTGMRFMFLKIGGGI